MTALDILYVDDDPDIRTIVELALSLDPEISTRIAATGEEALAIVAAGRRPDVALLDVMMPGIDGLVLMDRMHALPGAAGVPVIFVTARARQADAETYRARGAIGVIVKPFDPITLVGEIRGIVAAASNGGEHRLR